MTDLVIHHSVSPCNEIHALCICLFTISIFFWYVYYIVEDDFDVKDSTANINSHINTVFTF